MHGFHGTGRQYASYIIEHEDWSNSYVSNCLGDGVYFFVDTDEDTAARQAYTYHIGKLAFHEPVWVVAATINDSSQTNWLRLDDEKWKKLLESIKIRLRQEESHSYKNDERLNHVAVEWMCEWIKKTYSENIVAVQQKIPLQNSYIRPQVSSEECVCVCIRDTKIINKSSIIKVL